MKFIQYTLLLFLITSFGCKKFLEVQPKGVVIPKTISDYETILNSNEIIKTYPYLGWMPTDEIKAFFPVSNTSPDKNLYLWVSDIDADTKVPPSIWSTSYTSVYYSNIIIKEVMQASDGTEQQKKQLYAEALANRANDYFNLLEFFVKPYDAATAATDLGIPLATSIDVSEKAPARSTVKECYDAIIKDLLAAANDVPAKSLNKFRVSKAGVYGMLSRVYMVMGMYDKAQEFADKVLETNNILTDYNAYNSRDNFPPTETSPESVWIKFSDYIYGAAYQIASADLVSLYATGDFRKDYLLENYDGDYYFTGYPLTVNFGISVPEMMLNKAENLARNNKVNDAMDIINFIRQKRIATADYTPLAATDKEDALTKVLNERRVELAVKGRRWSDMRRLDKENRMPAVKRYDADGVVIATLEPHSPKYVFQIPKRVTMLNPAIKPN